MWFSEGKDFFFFGQFRFDTGLTLRQIGIHQGLNSRIMREYN